MTAHPRPNSFASPPQRIAVVGSGISGLSAAWLLGHQHEVQVYEEAPWAGGHSNTVDVDGPDGRIAVDTGFIVYNEPNYPNLAALFRHLGVATKPTDMSFAASLDGGSFEYSSADLNGLLGQRSNVASARFWRMVRDIWRFYRNAAALTKSEVEPDVTLGSFLDAQGYSDELVNDHILPMCAAIWSTTADAIRAFPMATFVRFFGNHGLLDLTRRPQWRTVDGGSRRYVERLRERIGKRLMLGNGARRIARGADGVTIEDQNGHRKVFDSVVVATHADQALRIIDDPSMDELLHLGAFRYTENVAVLHDDSRLMPRRRRVWSSWNYIEDERVDDDRSLCVTYWMNRLQGINPCQPLFVTLNPTQMPAPSRVKGTFRYSHPLFDAGAMRAQRELWTIQGHRRTWFCGAYFGYGFHEDGLQSGLAVAEALGGMRRPWTVADESGRINLPTMEAAE